MKEKLKVYHGLPKESVHEKTVLYASFDGTMNPEISGAVTLSSNNQLTYKPSVCSYGLYSPVYKTTENLRINFKSPLVEDVYTVDYWVDTSTIKESDMLTVSNGLEMYGVYTKTHDGSGDIRLFAFHKHTKGYYSILIRIYTISGNKDYYIPCVVGLNHVRIIREGNTFSLYSNGVLYNRDTLELEERLSIPNLSSVQFYGLQSIFCDFRIVNANLGDNFPTLPQDFIDGKAIVVPALNQRQSYGDPVLHQVTELLVKSQPMEVLGTIYDLNDVDSDGLERCFNNPELRTANAHTWEATWGKIRITGLDNTYITGVIDTDTSKCIVTSSIPTNATTGSFTVDDTSKLIVGDRLWIYSSTMSDTWELNDTNYLQITAINHTTKEVTATTNRSTGFKVTNGDILIETTASSSSPVVKTVDGVTVNGTWSGLGTYVATFTLGNNSNIAGKDLIVTYCLNARGNASPYPKMPSEVIRGYDELGNEMTPVTDLIFKDNLQNKTQGNTKICPHKVYWQNSISINEFIGSELDSNSYALINSPSDYYSYSAMPREYSMIIAEVDVIALIESKIGQRIPGNKYNWIINNVNSIRCHATCRGNTGSENYIEIRYRTKNGQFNLNSSSSCKHTSMDFKEIYATGGTELLNSDCKIMFALVTKHSSDVVIPTAEVKDFRFEVVFKTSEIYNYLANSDMWSRTGTVVNPILVDKQTKEVKRLVPSNAPFSTEVIVHNPTVAHDDVLDYRESCRGNFVFLTTLGTGKTTPTSEPLRGCIGNLDVTNNYLYTGDSINSLVLSDKAYKFCTRQPQIGVVNANEFSMEDAPQTNYLAITYDLVESNSVLYLKAFIEHLNHKSRSGKGVRFYEIPNRPLIK